MPQHESVVAFLIVTKHLKHLKSNKSNTFILNMYCICIIIKA